MLKKFSKFLLFVLVLFVVTSSSLICFADEEHDHEHDSASTSETNGESTSTEVEIHYGDLYLFDTNIVMDKMVDGNVFIFGNNVEITGQVNGNLFIFADKVYYNGACNDLYVAATNLEMTYDSYVARDVKAMGSNVTLKSFVVRDVDLLCNTLNLGEGEDIPIIYGNLRYTSNNEITIPEKTLVSGSATYTKPSELNNTTSSVTDILIGFATCVFTTLALYVIFKKFATNFIEKTSNQKFNILKLLKAFGIGLISIILTILLFILLTATAIGVNLAFIIVMLFGILCLLSVPTLAISITKILKPILKIEKNSMSCLVLSLVSVILYGITLIPFIGGLLGLIINITAIGLIITAFIPHKELTDEEKAAKEESKKQSKEKRKQEKLEAKETKKKEKESKKENKNNK